MTCFHCLNDSLVWTNDFSFEDYLYEGDGIIHHLSCTNCGAKVIYLVPLNKEAADHIGSEWEEKDESKIR